MEGSTASMEPAVTVHSGDSAKFLTTGQQKGTPFSRNCQSLLQYLLAWKLILQIPI